MFRTPAALALLGVLAITGACGGTASGPLSPHAQPSAAPFSIPPVDVPSLGRSGEEQTTPVVVDGTTFYPAGPALPADFPGDVPLLQPYSGVVSATPDPNAPANIFWRVLMNTDTGSYHGCFDDAVALLTAAGYEQTLDYSMPGGDAATYRHGRRQVDVGVNDRAQGGCQLIYSITLAA